MVNPTGILGKAEVQVMVVIDGTDDGFDLRLWVFSVFLGNIKQAFDKNPDLSNLLLDSFFKEEIKDCQVGEWLSLSLELCGFFHTHRHKRTHAHLHLLQVCLCVRAHTHTHRHRHTHTHNIDR